MKMKIGIFGGDDRHCYLANELILRGHEVWVWELGNRGRECPVLSEFHRAGMAKDFSELAERAEVLAGPVPFAKYLAAKENFEHVLQKGLRSGQHFFAGGIPEGLSLTLQKQGVKITDYLKTEGFLKKNAELTAQGCAGEVIGAWKGSLKRARVLVTGFGCCGREIARVLRGVGAEVTICVRRMQSALEAYEEGFGICYYEQLGSILPETDIVINTVPARVFGEGQLRRAKSGTLFVEIASAPGGFLPEVAKGFGMQVMLCPGLPGKYAPQGAAEAMAECIEFESAFQADDKVSRADS